MVFAPSTASTKQRPPAPRKTGCGWPFTIDNSLCNNKLSPIKTPFTRFTVQLYRGTVQVSGGTGQLSGGAVQLSGGVGQVSGSVGQVSGSAVQLSGGVGQVSGGAGQVYASAVHLSGGPRTLLASAGTATVAGAGGLSKSRLLRPAGGRQSGEAGLHGSLRWKRKLHEVRLSLWSLLPTRGIRYLSSDSYR
jgi:X-X-X-Leu-X-X-Gly heptad repeat protein